MPPALRRTAAVLVLLAAAPALAGCPAPPAQPIPPALRWVDVTVPAGLATAPFDVARRLALPIGWTASVYARLAGPRFLAATPDGRLLVSQPGSGQVQLVGRDASGTTSVREFLGGLNRPHDIVFADLDGRSWVYVAEAHRVVRYPYTAGDARARAGEVVVDGLPDSSTPELRGQYAHVLKNIAVHGGRLYVSIASTCNACVEDTVSDPQRAAIYSYDAAGYNAGRHLFARGLRNAEGLAIAPGTDELWVVVNNRDNILVPDDRDVDGDGRGDRGQRLTAYVDNHPPEEFIHVADGGFYGWPFCNPSIDAGLRDMPYDRDDELNRDGTRADCAAADRVTVGIQAHSAPLGLTFVPGLGAVVGLHGSWNSSRPVGYKLIVYPWRDGPGEERDLAVGFLDQAGTVWARPVDIAVDGDGSLLVSVDKGDAILRLTPPGPSRLD